MQLTQVQAAVATTLPVVLGGSDGGEELVPGVSIHVMRTRIINILYLNYDNIFIKLSEILADMKLD